ncbi:CDP-alcohol phosphatidyltransferase family protein [Lapillicoccus sp.]|uniref:CDP-alcohol phosphatidyltransferase family protein n=1 Tax=Lapillicoccus sp. TaxID=1909287 RepID=UPI003267B12B
MTQEGTGGPPEVSSRVLTIPNALSALRLVGVPVFLWLLFSDQLFWSFVVLALSGLTDYLDGKIARRFAMVSRVGQLLDPLADRLYVLTTIVALALRDVIPLWFLILLLARDAFMAILILLLKRVGQTGLPVHFVGKAATFNLLYAFPVLLLADVDGWVGTIARPVGWAFAWWGTGLYWLAAGLYALQAVPILRRQRRAP